MKINFFSPTRHNYDLISKNVDLLKNYSKNEIALKKCVDLTANVNVFFNNRKTEKLIELIDECHLEGSYVLVCPSYDLLDDEVLFEKVVDKADGLVCDSTIKQEKIYYETGEINPLIEGSDTKNILKNWDQAFKSLTN